MVGFSYFHGDRALVDKNKSVFSLLGGDHRYIKEKK